MAVANPTLVQSNVVATSTSGPATIVAALGVASTAGTTLFMSVTVTGSTPTVSTPANWTLITNNGNAPIATYMFARANNPGGITTVTVTLNSDTSGGAVATMFEVANMPPILAVEYTQNGQSGSNQNPNLTRNAAIPDVEEFCLYSVGFVSTATLSSINTPSDYSGNTSGGTSTVATTNVTLVNRLAINGGPSTPTDTLGAGFNPGVGCNLSAAVACAYLLARFLSLASTPIGVGAGGSVFVSNEGNPAGSLQVPQPIAPGNFFSGTTGSF